MKQISRLLAAITFAVVMQGCGEQPGAKLLARAEALADKSEALVAAIKEIPPGDVEAAKRLAPKFAKLYAEYGQALRDRTEAIWLTKPVTLTIDEKVREAKVVKRLGAFPTDLAASGSRLTGPQQAALFTAEIQLIDAQCSRWAVDPWYLRSYELAGQCEDLQRLGKTCEWAKTLVELSSAMTLEALAEDVRRVHGEGYESAIWEQMASTKIGLYSTATDMREKLWRRVENWRYLYKQNSVATTWSNWLERVKSDCPSEYEQLAVCGLKVLP